MKPKKPRVEPGEKELRAFYERLIGRAEIARRDFGRAGRATPGHEDNNTRITDRLDVIIALLTEERVAAILSEARGK